MVILLYFLAIAFLILFPDETADAAFNALTIWGKNIVPTLFPYMVFSRLLFKKLESFRLPAFPLITALSLTGGSPSGAAAIAADSHRLSDKDIYVLCALCGTISPIFILGTMNSWINSVSLCRRLLACHWLSAGISAWASVLLFHYDHQKVSRKSLRSPIAAIPPITQSIDACLQVGGCVILYSVLASMLKKLLNPFPSCLPLVHAALEVSGGIHAICQSKLSLYTKSIFLSGALGFNGFSILSQNHAMLAPIAFPMRRLILFAMMRAVCSASLMGLVNLFLPIN